MVDTKGKSIRMSVTHSAVTRASDQFRDSVMKGTLALDIFKTRRSSGENPAHPAFGEVGRLPHRLQRQRGRISAPVGASPFDHTHGLSRAALGRG